VQGSIRRAIFEGVALFPKTFGACGADTAGSSTSSGQDALPTASQCGDRLGGLAALTVFLVRRARSTWPALLAQNAASTGRRGNPAGGDREARVAARDRLFWLIVVAILQAVFTRLGWR
jgi:hypothetical protein